ncbi:MAG: ATP synthase F0 subunit B [Patescibacteria group bacterium]|nr:ATP synthase F0 subunit B [Patescibacteria group bacterium]
MDLLTKIGIEPKLLLAQVVNFGIVVFIIYYFLHKPLSNLIKTRREKIESGLKKEKEAEELMAKVQSLRQDILTAAAKEKEEIILATRAKLVELEEAEREKLVRFELNERKKIEAALAQTEKELAKEIEAKFPALFLNLSSKIFPAKDLNEKFIKAMLEQTEPNGQNE